jgi:hypothetical protein
MPPSASLQALPVATLPRTRELAAPLLEPPDHLDGVEGGPFVSCVPLAELLGRLARHRAERRSTAEAVPLDMASLLRAFYGQWRSGESHCTRNPLFVQWNRICKHYAVTGDLLGQPILADLLGVRIYV